jgi:ATP-dependent 26S proteasome regulatory subunit
MCTITILRTNLVPNKYLISLFFKQWFGDAEKLTKALFSFASRLAPVIIFVDEVCSLK